MYVTYYIGAYRINVGIGIQLSGKSGWNESHFVTRLGKPEVFTVCRHQLLPWRRRLNPTSTVVERKSRPCHTVNSFSTVEESNKCSHRISSQKLLQIILPKRGCIQNFYRHFFNSVVRLRSSEINQWHYHQYSYLCTAFSTYREYPYLSTIYVLPIVVIIIQL